MDVPRPRRRGTARLAKLEAEVLDPILHPAGQGLYPYPAFGGYLALSGWVTGRRLPGYQAARLAASDSATSGASA